MADEACAHAAAIVHLSSGPECVGRTECASCGRYLPPPTPVRLAAVAVDGAQVWSARPQTQRMRRIWLDGRFVPVTDNR